MAIYSRPTLPRDPNESHRAATPLELLFDLVSVIAIALAVASLHHAISDNHAIEGLISYSIAFFAIWWAWMNYTWYASAYDNDDTLFRLLSMFAMSGSLVIAVGIEPFFKSSSLTVIISGYVIMRLAMMVLWLRAAAYDNKRKNTALTYAFGITIAQVYWVALILIKPAGPSLFYGLFGLGILLELVVPVIAERKNNTPWHRGHITERYGLLFIIVMGELLLGGALALKAAYPNPLNSELLTVVVCSLVITFSMWWLYFAREKHLQKRSLSHSILWGYGHFIIFGSAATVGGGLAVFVDIFTDHAKIGVSTAGQAVAIPLILYLISLWFVRERFVLSGASKWVLPLFAVLTAFATVSPMPLETLTVAMVLCVLTRNYLARSAPHSVVV